MGARERNKGAVGELELAAWLSNRGYPAWRGRQFSGSPESPDVVCPSLAIHFEVKRTERLSLYPAMAQAIGDAGERMPLVAHRRNCGEWLAVLRLEDLLKLMRGSS